MQAQAADMPVKATPAAEAPDRTGGSTATSRSAAASSSTIRSTTATRSATAVTSERAARAWPSTTNTATSGRARFGISGWPPEPMMGSTRSNSAARTSATTISGYWLDASKAGQHYFNFMWDQSPHLYSTTAQTFYQGVGTTNADAAAGRPFRHATGATHRAVPLHDRYRHQARHRVGRLSLDPGPMPGTSRQTTRTCIAPARRSTAWSAWHQLRLRTDPSAEAGRRHHAELSA